MHAVEYRTNAPNWIFCSIFCCQYKVCFKQNDKNSIWGNAAVNSEFDIHLLLTIVLVNYIYIHCHLICTYVPVENFKSVPLLVMALLC